MFREAADEEEEEISSTTVLSNLTNVPNCARKPPIRGPPIKWLEEGKEGGIFFYWRRRNEILMLAILNLRENEIRDWEYSLAIKSKICSCGSQSGISDIGTGLESQ